MKKPSSKMLLCVLTALLLAASVLFVACSDDPEPQPPAAGAEQGTYYYDSEAGEYLLALTNVNEFALTMGDKSFSGTYVLNGETFAFTFAAPADAQISATYKDDVVTLTYGTSTMRFLRKVEYKVTFDSNGGSAVAEQTVVNGKTLAKPADPTKENSTFIWWYTDNNTFKEPFAFGVKPVTAPITLYARWAGKPSAKEFTVNFDLNYDGATNNIPAVTTIGGKVYITAPAPERSGYVFDGWYVSTAHSGDKLSYPVTEDIVFAENTTVYACWSVAPAGSKLATPKVTVSATEFSWERVSGATQYAYTVTDPNEDVVLNSTTTATSVKYDFEQAGEYKIEVTAVHSNTANNSAAAVRYYTAKSLARVSGFTVTGGNVLTFDKVANATGYRITVVCGNSAHTHINENIQEIGDGDTVSYSFAGCPMREDGIRFTVTAYAAGYVSSVSEPFVFNRALAAVEGLAFNTETSVLTWNAVDNAEEYEVKVNSTTVKVTATEFSLKEYAAGTYNVSVKPVAFGYNSPAAATLKCEKAGEAAPANVRLEGTMLKWDKVGEENNYTVLFNSEEIQVSGVELDLTDKLSNVDDGTDCSVAVKVAGDGNAYSAALTGKKGVLEGELVYSNGIVSWNPAFGADSYIVETICAGDEQAATKNVSNTSCSVDFEKAGTYTVTVKVNEQDTGITLDIVVRKISLDVKGGSALDNNALYLVAGDKLVLPETVEKTNYVFAGWYDSPDGPEVNARKYESGEIFRGSENLELYAYYTPKPFNVTYTFANGESGVQDTDVVYYDTDYRLIVPVHEDLTKAFMGWYSTPSGDGVQYTNSLGERYYDVMVSSDITVYARWFDNIFLFTLDAASDTYTVSYDRENSSSTFGLYELNIPETYNDKRVTAVGDFSISSLRKVTIPNTVNMIAQQAFSSDYLTEIEIVEVEGNTDPVYFSEDGIVYQYGDEQRDIPTQFWIVPNGVTGEITVPHGIETINAGAFSGSKIKSITIPASVNSIAPEAFMNCSELTEVTVLNGAETFTIGDRAFRNCQKLTTLNLPAGLTELPLARYFLGALLDETDGPSYQEVYEDLDKFKNSSVDDEKMSKEIVDFAYVSWVDRYTRNESLVSEININGNNALYQTIDGVIYNKAGDTLLYFPAGKGGDFVVPNNVRTIAAGAFFGNSKLNSVTIHNLGVEIQELAFYGCTALTKVTFAGGGVSQPVTIGKYAFRDSSLQEIVFADNCNVTSIGEGAFVNCKSLNGEVKIPASMAAIGNKAFARSAITKLTFANGANPTLGNFLLYYCESLASYEIGDSVSVLPSFEGCSALTELKISDNNPNFSVDEHNVVFNKDKTELLYYPVFGSESEYTVPNSVKEIAAGAFKNNSKLTSVTLGSGLEIIGDEAFGECSNLASVTFEDGGTATTLEIGYRAFYRTALTAFTVPARTQSIGNAAFAYVSSLVTLAFENTADNPSKLLSIGDQAFYSCSRIGSEITIPKSVRYIGAEAFGYYWSGNSAVFTFESGGTDGLVIGTYAFARNSGTVNADLSRVTAIGQGAFYRCSALRTVTLPTSLEYDRATVFAGCSSELVITGGKQTAVIYEDVLDRDGNKIGLELTAVRVAEDETFEISADVTVVAEGAFNGIEGIKTVTFAPRTKDLTIEDSAFANSGIETIALPEQVKSFGRNVFEDCAALTNVTLPSGIKSIPNYTFKNCTNLSSFDFSNITSIGTEAFKNCGFTSVDLSGLTSIGTGAFQNCSSLTAATLPENYEYSSALFAGCADSLVVTGGILKVANYTDNGDGTRTLVKFLDTVVTTFEIPADVTVIGYQAFNALSNIKTVTFANSDKPLVIEAEAFEGSGLERIVLPARLTSLEGRTFTKCKSLVYVEFAAGCPITAIDDYLGWGCFESCSNLKTIVLPENLKKVGGYFIGSCSGLTLYFPGYADEEAAKAAFGGSISWVGSHTVIYGTRPAAE